MKYKLWLTLVTHTAFCILKNLYEGCLMGGMNKFTLLRAFTVGIGDKDYELKIRIGIFIT